MARLALSVSWCLAGAARAEAAAPLELNWQVPKGCPDRDVATAAIARALPGGTAQTPDPVVVNVQIRALAVGSRRRFEARMQMRGPDQRGERVFAGEDCSRVVDAAVLIIALSLDPVGVSAPRSRAPMSMPGESLQLGVGLRVTGDVGSLPAPTLGIAANLGLRYARASVELDASYWLPQFALGVPTRDSGGEIALYAAALRAYYAAIDLRSSQLQLAPGIGMELGRSSGRGIQLEQPERPAAVWALAWAGVALRQSPRSGLATDLSIGVGVPLRRPMYVVEGRGVVFQASPVVVRATLGARWLF